MLAHRQHRCRVDERPAACHATCAVPAHHHVPRVASTTATQLLRPPPEPILLLPRSQLTLSPLRATAALAIEVGAGAQQDEGTEHASNACSNNGHLTDAEQEALEVLEWPAVSRQVARLCGTIMGAQLLAQGGLPLGRTYEDSQNMLQQTQEAFDLELSVQGVYDLSPALDGVQQPGACLNAKQLEGIANSLQAALDIKSRVQAKGHTSSPAGAAARAAGSLNGGDAGSAAGGGVAAGEEEEAAGAHWQYPALAALAAGIAQEEAITLQAIRHCIRLGSVSDEASEQLARLRAERRDNADKLRTLMEGIARGLYEKGASDSRSVTIIRDRYCVGIKAGRQSDLPKGSVKLGSSQTGATMYYEPAPAIPLNNAAALLAAKEAEEETAVLLLLSRLIASRAEAMHQLLDAVTQLDVVAARARHARIFGSRRPVLVPAHDQHASSHHAAHSSKTVASQAGQTTAGRQHGDNGSSDSDRGLVWVPGAKHPLLFERALPEPLPEPPSLDDNRFDRNFAPPPIWEARRSVLGGGPGSASSGPSGPAPQALDLRVPGQKQVVAITGPNTGGKTVTLKALGLMALMAKAGMFLPVQQQTQQQQQLPCVGWFSRVLADIGDAQSLQQNLSTFSGHIRRIKQVLAAADAGSLVLLDEVGSGTDPVEGAALARAILDKLAGRAALTVATTHHAELKQVAGEDGRYCTVSMEFDVASLRPTYRLLWGQVGASNALDIARSLGFDSAVVSEAEEVARSTFEAQEDRAARLAATAASLVKQLQDAQLELAEAQGRRQLEESTLVELRQRITEAQALYDQLGVAPKLILKRVREREAAMNASITAYAAGKVTREQVDVQLRALEEECRNKIAQMNNQAALTGAVPEVGDRVVVPARHQEDTLFTVVAVQGSVATLRPEGALGAGLQLVALSMGNTRTRDKRGATIRVPLAEVKVVQRRASIMQEAASAGH